MRCVRIRLLHTEKVDGQMKTSAFPQIYRQWMKQRIQELLMHSKFNRGVRLLLSPLRHLRYLPKSIWLRLPVVGTFAVGLPNGQSILYQSHGEYTGRVLYWRGFWDIEPGSTKLFSILTQSAKTFLDIGAHVGLYTLLAKASNPAIQVIAFEPIPYVCNRLKINIELNRFVDSVTIEQVVIANTYSSSVPFFVSNDVSTSSLYSQSTNSRVANHLIEVRAYELDRYVEQQHLASVDLIKIDVEGAEIDVLTGGQQTLQHQRPIIMCEILPKNNQAFTKIEDFLNGKDYEYGMITDEFILHQPHLLPHQTYHNYLLWPKEKRSLLIASKGINILIHD